MGRLAAISDIVKILFEYHGVLVFSKNVLHRLRLIDESIAGPAPAGPAQLGGVAAPPPLDPDLVEVVGIRMGSEGLDRSAELLELGGGGAEERGVVRRDHPGGGQGARQTR